MTGSAFPTPSPPCAQGSYRSKPGSSGAVIANRPASFSLFRLTTSALALTAGLLAACGSEPVASPGDSVSVHYTGTLDDGSIFDSSVRSDPLSFVVASGQMIPGFDAAVNGMKVGEKITVRLEPSQAYGEPLPNLIVQLPVHEVPEGVGAGDILQSGNGQQALVVDINETTVTIDANHRLAGVALTFEIELVEIADGS
jgi:FKBP-type peptidyl-prolyl cis-trans isomerase 2